MKKFFVLFLAVLFLSGIPASAEAMFIDNFDSYQIGAWATDWIADANALNAPNGVKADPLLSYAGDNALYLQGRSGWAPLAHHAAAFEQSFDISASMYFNSANMSLADGFISLSASAGWTTTKHIFELQAGNAKVGSSIVKTGITADAWHDIDIQFRRLDGERYGSVSYYLDNEFLGTWSSSVLSGAIWDQDYHYLTLVANNRATGQYMYFDDVSVSSPADSGASNPVPEPATMLLLGSGLIGLFAANKRKV